MKILICVHNLANGGAERVASLWANGFINKGDEVTIVLAEKDAPIEYDISSKVLIENIWTGGSPFFRYLKKIVKLRRIIMRTEADVAIGVMAPWDIWLLLAALGLKTKPVFTIHNAVDLNADKYTKRHTISIPRFFPIVTVLTNTDYDLIKTKIVNSYVMPNPLAFDAIYVPEKKENIILASGRLDAWYVKGFDTLIKAWGLVSNNHPGWKLQLAGRGDDKSVEFINNLVEENGIQSSFELLGFRTNILEDYDRASIFAFTSRYDGFGMVLIEAMSRGCACVACDFEGRQAEIVINGINGLLCEPEDVNSIANALEKLISDQELRKSLQRNATIRASYYSLNNTIERWYGIFKDNGIV